jgi:hypothetical protein
MGVSLTALPAGRATPVFLHPGNGVGPAYAGYFSIAETYLGHEQVD